jgi:histone acetyltransferase (RNA polymerase elongator complex component)
MPEIACPQKCTFCDQRQISGQSVFPDNNEIIQKIESHLASYTRSDREVEIAFFGGTFTGLPLKRQENYLSIASKYLINGLIHGIRISTRPDYIDTENLQLLKHFGVTTIELGAQSLDDEVLIRCERGHTVMQVEKAATLIKQYGFNLGLQMMIGLPDDSFEKSIATAKKIILLGAKETRIYPCLVIKNTILAQEFETGIFKPLDLENAVSLSAELWLLFEKAGVKVIRLGLHRSEELNEGAMIAGPYHISFKELVMSHIWKNVFLTGIADLHSESIHIQVHPKELNFAVGYLAGNKAMLMKSFQKVRFSVDDSLVGRDFHYTLS